MALEKYPLISKKNKDYFFFKQIVLLMLKKEHNNLEGLKKAVVFRSNINLGLSSDLKEAFPDIDNKNKLDNSPALVPVNNLNNIHPE